MKEKVRQLSHTCLTALPIAAFVLILVLLLKQLTLFSYLVSLYHALLPVIMGAIIAFLLQPLIDRLSAYMPLKAAVFLVYSGLFLFLLVLLVVLLPLLYQQATELLSLLPQLVEKGKHWLQRYMEQEEIERLLRQGYSMLSYDAFLSQLQGMLSSLAAYGIAYMTAFFLSIDLEFWKRSFHRLRPKDKRFSTFYHTVSSIIYQYLRGTLLDLLFISISTSAVLLCFSFPNAVLYSVLLALLNLFPYIGSIFGQVLIALVAMFHYAEFPWLMLLIVWALQQVEANVIQPMIFHHTMHVRPLLTFAFLFLSEALLGLPGMILSPILAAMAQIAFRSWLHAKSSDQIGSWEDIWVDFEEAIRQENAC